MSNERKNHTLRNTVIGLFTVCILAGLTGGAYWAAKNVKIDTNLGGHAADKSISEGEENTTESTDDSTGTIKQNETVTDDDLIVTDVTKVVENVMPSIVAIDNNYTQNVTYWGYSFGEEEVTASGSGIIIGENDTELLIVTNNHVIDDADSLKVQFIDGAYEEANIKGTNADLDLAVIAVDLDDLDDDTKENISVATFGDSDTLLMGEPAIAIGNALGYGQSVTTGVISATNRTIEFDDGSEGTFIQTDAAINPGNSGGALLNARGEVIGINSSKFASEEVEGMGFAIPSSVAKPIIDELMNEETKVKADSENRGYLGITVYTPTGIEGAYVASVGSGSAAEKAGIKAGDIITALDDNEITSRDDLIDILDYYEAGTKVTLSILRKEGVSYKTIEVDVTLQTQDEALSATQDNSNHDENPGFSFGY